jgi:alpha-beta hydrolase superfamily lysophospholipase
LINLIRKFLLIAAAVLAALWALALDVLPGAGAGGLLHPARHPLTEQRPSQCENERFNGLNVVLRGWRCRAASRARGTLVYLHGIADNRGSASGAIKRLTARGFDVVAYDSRAHGESQGDVCTYGYFEKGDLKQVLNTVNHYPIILMGTSLGAAVALQEAAEDPRVSGVVAAEVFSDLRTVASERAPWFFSSRIIARAFQQAEQTARFRVDDVSPMRSAANIRVPVLLIHGAADRDTRPDHSRRVFAALQGPKRLILVEGAGHNQSLNDEHVWIDIDTWLDGLASS